MAIASLVLGIVGVVTSFFYLGGVLGIIGLIFSILVLRKGKNGMAIAGLVCSAVAIVISILMVVSCSLNEDGSTTKNAANTTTETSANKSENLAEQMQVKEYSCLDYFGDRRVAFLITNPTDKEVSISMNITAKDAAGNALASSNQSVYELAANSDVIVSAYLDNVDMNATIDYKMDVKKISSGSSATPYVALNYNINGDKVVFTATNNGTQPAYFLEAQVIYLRNGEMVSTGETYLIGDDSSLKPGETRTGEDSCYTSGGFDDVIVTYTGRTRYV